MQKAKQAVASFVSKDGKHNTTVDQDVRGAVTDEHVRPHEHEVVTTAVDREVHQDHHQTRIQPVHATETLPETSSHQVAPVQHTTHQHGDDSELRKKLDLDAAGFKSTSVTHNATHSTEAAPMVSGEHVHHHVHEHVQPVIHKETITPHVVHKTIPVHETHHAAPIHHEATTLPAKTLEEFTSGRDQSASMEPKASSTLREFDGCPGPYNKERELPSTALHADSDDSLNNNNNKRMSNSSNEGNYSTATSGGIGAAAVPRSANDTGSTLNQTNTTSSANTQTSRSRSIIDKLNPRIDADGDGKKGILS